MIVRICGNLEAIESNSAIITPPGGMTYQVLVSAYTCAKLSGKIGSEVSLHTIEFYESLGQGTTMLPRMAGFLTLSDKAFYELFVTCKGIGYKKALRALSINTHTIAAAIADRDITTLQSLPEIGKKTAEGITLSLREKVDGFLAQAQSSENNFAQDGNEQLDENAPTRSRNRTIINEAINALVQLGENRAQATTWIDRIMSEDNPPATSQELLARVYRIKES